MAQYLGCRRAWVGFQNHNNISLTIPECIILKFLGAAISFQVLSSDKGYRFLPILQTTLQLSFFDAFEDFLESRSRAHAHLGKVVSRQEAGRAHLVWRGLAQELLNKLIGVQFPVAAKAI